MLLEVKTPKIMILDVGLITKLNPHFFFITGTRFKIIINTNLGFELFHLITQIILTQHKLIILPSITTNISHKFN
jgi:hypothetical protein